MSDKTRRLNKLSVGSFILGLLIFFCDPSRTLWLIILAVSLGYLARRQIKESGFLQKGIIFANAGILIGLFSFFVAISFMTFNGRAREQLRRGVCLTNLKLIGEAVYFYAADNDMHFPEKLSSLYPSYIPKPVIFWCPSDKNPKPSRIDNDIPDNKNSALISYQYSPGHKDDDSPLIPIVWDNGCEGKDDNHGSDGGNVLYLSGKAVWRPGHGNLYWKWTSRRHGEALPAAY